MRNLFNEQNDMTQEGKQLLLTDLCGRSPYKVICQVTFDEDNIFTETLESVRPYTRFNQVTTNGSVVSVESIKPYLRPMESMTEEEEEEYSKYYIETNRVWIRGKWIYFDSYNEFEYLNKKMFDCRGLIKLGLALEAPEGMYRKEEEK